MDRELTYVEDAVTGKMSIWLTNLASSLNPNIVLDLVKLKDENRKLKEILNPPAIEDTETFITLSRRLNEVDVGFHTLKKISPFLGTHIDNLKLLVSYVEGVNALSELDLNKIQEYRGILVDIVSGYLSNEDKYLLDKH